LIALSSRPLLNRSRAALAFDVFASTTTERTAAGVAMTHLLSESA
jgi:hypothetical protein